MNRRRLLATASSTLLASAARAQGEASFRVAVIGHTGRGNYGHGLDTMWLRLPQTKIIAVADADPKGLASAVDRLGGVPGFEDYHRMLSETRPDIVAIGPRHVGQRLDMCLAAVAAGARGIYVEKPFCRTPAEADRIVTACAQAGAKLAVAHRNRYHPALPVAKQWIADGRIGTVLELRGRGKEDARGGALDFWVLGSHVSNLATHFGGTPVACSGLLYQDGVPCAPSEIREGDEELGLLAGNQLHARFELADGVPYFFDSRQNAGVKKAGFGLQIIGTDGVLDFRSDAEPLVHFRPGNPFHPSVDPTAWQPVNPAKPIVDLARFVSSHQAAGEDLLNAIAQDRPALCSAEEARVTVEMACAVFESHRQGGKRITFPLANRENPLADWR